MTKYYEAQNAGRGPIGGVFFQITEVVGGTAFGVYSTDDEGQQATLDALLSNPGNALTSIGQSEFDAAIKKKAPALESSPTWRNHLTPAQSVLKGRGAVIVDDDPPEPEAPVEIKTTVESVDEALALGEAKPADGIEGEAPAQTRRGIKKPK